MLWHRPDFLAATPIWGIWIQQLSGADPETTQAEFNVYAMALVLWTAWVGAALLRLNLGIGWRRALVLLGKTYLMFFGLMLLLEVGILMILGTLIMGPH